MPSPLPDAAVEQYAAQQRIAASTSLLVRRLWRRLDGDFDALWRILGPQIALVLSAGQRASAQSASAYVPAVLDELNISADAEGSLVLSSLTNIASDGRPLAGLLYEPVIATKTALGQGSSLQQALDTGWGRMSRIVDTQIADAGRDATSVETAVRPAVTHYVRMLNLPSCDRCVILAGKTYRWNAGFQRHPHCDCRHIPATEDVAGDLRTDPRAAIEAGQVRGLSKADTRAVLDGADPGKVVNAHRGMYTAQNAKMTRALTKRGEVRLRPETIYQMAGDRAEAIALLRKYRYII